MLRIGWITTGRGEGSRGFFETVQNEIVAHDLAAQIEFVFMNRDPGEAEGSDSFMRQVHDHDIPLATLSSRRYRREHGGGPFSKHRISFHREAVRLLAGFQPDVCVLAGYMLFSGPELVDRWPTINLHPAAPWGPAGMWQDVIWQAIEEGATESGVRVHVATEVLDAGPLLTYCTYPIRGPGFDPLWDDVADRSLESLKREGEEQPLFKSIRREGLKRERPLLLETIRALAEGSVIVRHGQVLDAEGSMIEPRCLNPEVTNYLRAHPD